MTILCTIDLETREVSIPSGQCIAAYDHNVDVIRFQAETIPGFSLNTSTIRIAAQGPNKSRHDYAVDPSTVQIEEETGYITFDWPIPAGVTEMPLDVFKYGDKGQLIFAVCAEIISGNTVSKAWHSDDGIITVVAHLEPESGGGEDPEEEATNAQKIAQLQTNVAVINTQVGALANGSPTPVATVAEMTDESAVYLYTGSETGYTAGNWYYYNGSAWTSGGTYGGAVTDTTLSISGAAADAKAVGEALALKADDTDVDALDTRVTVAEGDVDDIKSALNQQTVFADTVFESGSVAYDPTYTNNSMNQTTGEQSSYASNRTSTPGMYFFPVECDMMVIYDSSAVSFNVYCYDINKTFIGRKSSGETVNGKIPLVADTRYVRFFVVYVDNSDITPAQAKEAVVFTCKYVGKIVNVEQDIDALGADLELLNDNVSKSELINNYEFANPNVGYIDKYGHIASSSSYSYSNPVQISKGTNVILTAQGYNDAVAMIAKYENNTYTPLVISVDSTVRTYTYTATENINIVLSYRIASEHSCAFIVDVKSVINEIDTLKQNVMYKNDSVDYDFANAISGHFINPDGNISDSSNYSYTQPIHILKGAVVTFTAQGYSTSTSMISEYNSGTYKSLVISVDSTVRAYTYTAPKDMDIVLSYRTASTHSCTILTVFDMYDVYEKIDSISNGLEYLFLFHKMAGIGDSLMSGELYYSTQNHRDAYKYSWLSNLCRYADAECEHYSVGGMTAKAWINDAGGCRTALVNETELSNVYFIALGTNDKNQSEYQIGNISDVAGADSFVGYYKQIIELVHTHNPDAFVFCLSMYDSLTPSLPYSAMVKDISDLYSYCYFVDFAGNTEHTPKTTDIYAQNSHYTSLGYLYSAKLIKALVEKLIESNPNDFKWIGLNGD